jgi:hypothetical protein
MKGGGYETWLAVLVVSVLIAAVIGVVYIGVTKGFEDTTRTPENKLGGCKTCPHAQH